jgi:hypothetical protein
VPDPELFHVRRAPATLFTTARSVPMIPKPTLRSATTVAYRPSWSAFSLLIVLSGMTSNVAGRDLLVRWSEDRIPHSAVEAAGTDFRPLAD